MVRTEVRWELTPAPAARPRRPELQGLRGLAVGLVVVYHVWIGRVSGGVDVFFVLTGFLLTGQLLRAAARGPIDLRERWSRTAVRLVPPALVVLGATTVASWAVLPQGRWPQTLTEVVASALFLENWQLAADAVEYAARSNSASVVQHFWSLSIQVQYVLLWPAAAALLCRGADPARARRRLTAATAGLLAASLACSVVLTAVDQPLAYFLTPTRLWEFALGGLVALSADALRAGPRLRVALGWTGVVGLVAAGAVLRAGDVFPGWAALWPTGCAALVIAAGATGSRWGADRLLSAAPLRRLGDLSYVLYLWHWPVLVLYLVARGRDAVGPVGGAGVVGLSLLLAVATRHLVELPLAGRRLGVGGGYRVAAAGLAGLLVLAGVWQVEVAARTDLEQVGADTHPGALALVDGPVGEQPLRPPPVAVRGDWVPLEGTWDCRPLDGFDQLVCAYPMERVPQRRVVLVGDSHARQLSGALIPLAQQYDWELIGMFRDACPFSTASETWAGDEGCVAWNDAVVGEIAALRPDAVVTLATRDVRVGLTEHTPPGFVEQWSRLRELGIPVLAVRDNPRFDRPPSDCVELHGRGAPVCSTPRAELYAPEPPWLALDEVPDNVLFLDLADSVCETLDCPPEIGNVLVYLDDNHLTGTYVATMAPLLEPQVIGAIGP
jgi:peptidoglycan/LPS O-acetylase OafA/YrhL